MQQLTAQQVIDEYGGQLPPDAEMISDSRPSPSATPKAFVNVAKGSKGDRFGLLNAFVDGHLPELKGTEVSVWLILFRDTKRSTGYARTGQTDIARRAGVSLRAVQKAIQHLQEKRFLKLIQRGRLNSGPSTYLVSVPNSTA